jgi:F1F0 ATPase subunit 2
MINQMTSEAQQMVQQMLPITSLLTASLMGIALGCVFFYVLWLSAQKVVGSAHPVLWFVSSWLIRMAFALCGFYWIGNENWQLLLACLLGFIVGRWLISKIILGKSLTARTNLDSPTQLDKGANHAP